MKIIILISFIFMVKNIAVPLFKVSCKKESIQACLDRSRLELNGKYRDQIQDIVKKELAPQKRSFNLHNIALKDFKPPIFEQEIHENFTIHFNLATSNHSAEHAEILQNVQFLVEGREGLFYVIIIATVNLKERFSEPINGYFHQIARVEMQSIDKPDLSANKISDKIWLLEGDRNRKEEIEYRALVNLEVLSMEFQNLGILMAKLLKKGESGVRIKIKPKTVEEVGERLTKEEKIEKALRKEYILLFQNQADLLNKIYKEFFKGKDKHLDDRKTRVAIAFREMLENAEKELEEKKRNHQVENITKELVKNEEKRLKNNFKEYKKNIYKPKYADPTKADRIYDYMQKHLLNNNILI